MTAGNLTPEGMMNPWNVLGGIALMVGALTSCADFAERRVTTNPDVNHRLDMNHNFSPDGKWLVYDTRIDALTTARTIEKVNVETGEVVVLHRAVSDDEETGTGIGAVSYLPDRDEVVFIHGLGGDGLYGFTRRLGAIVPGDGSAADIGYDVRWADARDVTPPFTPGALRGGTHRHDPGGPGGRWLGFTYNDVIMAAQGPDLRALGVTMLDHPVEVDDNAENRSGEGFSAVIVSVMAEDEVDTSPESQDIFRATDDQWVGTRGYRKPDGSWRIARGFIGHMKQAQPDGSVRTHREVFIVEIPDDITVPGPNGPLEGTETAYPATPMGASQRRLTHTASGCTGLVRSTPDGSLLAFMSIDENRRPQICTMSPHSDDERAQLDEGARAAGAFRQVTSFENGVQEPPRWLPDGLHFVTARDNAVVIVNAETAGYRQLSDSDGERPGGIVVSPDGRTVAFNRLVPVTEGELAGQERLQIFVSEVVLPE